MMRVVQRRAFQRRSRTIQRYVYRGFEIRIVEKTWYDFKFEWEIRPLSTTAKRLLKLCCQHKFARKDGLLKVVYDPTSHRVLGYAVENAMERINEIHSPFWYLKPYKSIHET